MEVIDKKEMAQEAKKRGNALFAMKTEEAYKDALAAYTEAIEHDPTDPVFYANRSAVYAATAEKVYDEKQKLDNWLLALNEAKHCTDLGSTWLKGFLRRAQAEHEVLMCSVAWEKRKVEDKKFAYNRKKKKTTKVEGAVVEGEGDGGAVATTAAAALEEDEEEEEVLTEEQAALAGSCTFAGCEATCRQGLALDASSIPLRERLQALRDAGHETNEEADQAMRDPEAGDALKKTGNPLFSAKQFNEAAVIYTRALAADPFNHVLYSNRSACYAEEDECEKALNDANKCIRVKPDFAKGFSRKSLALYYLGRYSEAEAAAVAGLLVDGSNAALQDLLGKTKVETCESPEFQKQIHTLRQQQKSDKKMQEMISKFNLGGNVQMFNGMGGGIPGGLGNLFGGGGGGFGGKPAMGEAQMRQMAHAMSQENAKEGGLSN